MLKLSATGLDCWVRLHVPANGRLDDWAAAFDDVKFDAEHRQRREDVAEHDDAVWLERPPWLQRELCGNVGILGPLPEG